MFISTTVLFIVMLVVAAALAIQFYNTKMIYTYHLSLADKVAQLSAKMRELEMTGPEKQLRDNITSSIGMGRVGDPLPTLDAIISSMVPVPELAAGGSTEGEDNSMPLPELEESFMRDVAPKMSLPPSRAPLRSRAAREVDVPVLPRLVEELPAEEPFEVVSAPEVEVPAVETYEVVVAPPAEVKKVTSKAAKVANDVVIVDAPVEVVVVDEDNGPMVVVEDPPVVVESAPVPKSKARRTRKT